MAKTSKTAKKTYTTDANGIIEASENMTFVRNSDSKRFGHFIHLGLNDSIDNYHEEAMTEEEKENEFPKHLKFRNNIL